MTENKRFIGCFKGDMLVSIKDTITNKRLNILQIVEVANKIYDENEQLKQQLKKDNDVLDNTKQKLRDREKAFGELFKDYIDALKQKDGLEKKNVQLKKVMNDLYDRCKYWSDKASERITLLEKENENLKKALWKSETAYIEETNEFSIDVEKGMEWLKKEFERRYWND